MIRNGFFDVCCYEVRSERPQREDRSRVQAIVEVRVAHECIRRGADGVGPVHALDNALRACLLSRFPELEQVRLTDYRVGVVDGSDGTAAQVHVLINASDGEETWEADCVSDNIVDASFEALCSATMTGIMRARAAELRSA